MVPVCCVIAFIIIVDTSFVFVCIRYAILSFRLLCGGKRGFKLVCIHPVDLWYMRLGVGERGVKLFQ